MNGWRSAQEGFDVVWTFAPDGALRWELQNNSAWMVLLGANWDVRGRWQLCGDQLTMELQETPPALALRGADWTGQARTGRIVKLTDSELEFADSEMQFRRSLVPPKE